MLLINEEQELFKEVVQSLEEFVQNGMNTLIDLSHEEFNDTFIFNSKLRRILVPHWITFASYFTNQVEVDEILYSSVSNNEKFTIFMQRLRNSSEEVTIVQFLTAFKNTVLSRGI